MLLIASALLILIGFVHSYLGEKFILIRLFRRDNLPQLFGSDWFTKRVLRFAWHLTTVAWWGFAAILFLLSNPSKNINWELLLVISVVFIFSGVISFSFTRGKHFSWVFFIIIAALCFASLEYAV